jgi:imidazolonepropionase|tara:strand:+ start:518 stop:1762 length:1245 start_codon:yes stop_codon:yes gene_type:complete
MKKHQTLFINVRLATMVGEVGYGLIDDHGLLVEADQIIWIGLMSDRQSALESDPKVIDCQGRLMTPGLIDCHSHLVYGGDRADEFELRLEGASYEALAKAGGGIKSTVKATRDANQESLLSSAKKRLTPLLNEGVTTLEIKSGYGLDSETEIKMLRVAKQLEADCSVRIQKTFLGAHALPVEYADRSDDYIELVCNKMLPEAHAAGLVDAVDVFIENIAFTVAQAERVFDCAEALGLPVKAHVEQLSNMGGAVMTAKRQALSVDHIEFLAEQDVPAIAQNNTVAVLLPGAFYVLRETKLPPIDALRANGVSMAIATDANPGSSPVHSLLLIMNMACTLFRLTPSEALRGVTINAAKALGLDKELGSLSVGKQADLVLWDIDKPAMLSYQIGLNPCAAIMRSGIWRKPLESYSDR